MRTHKDVFVCVVSTTVVLRPLQILFQADNAEVTQDSRRELAKDSVCAAFERELTNVLKLLLVPKKRRKSPLKNPDTSGLHRPALCHPGSESEARSA